MTDAPARPLRLRRLLRPWLQPWPWISLGLLWLASRTEAPRFWFWLALLGLSLLVGLIQSQHAARR